MKHIHPFPARMAPEIALRLVSKLPSSAHVLDPMAGSGMVLQQCARAGLRASGRDLDPLACLISRTATTVVDAEDVLEAVDELLERARELRGKPLHLPWIDGDAETNAFIDYWFAPKQRDQLRRLAYLLFHQPLFDDPRVLDVLAVGMSRLIITKEPKASRARDTAHSRPHRTIIHNAFDVFANLPGSVTHVLNVLDDSGIQRSADVAMDDARKLRYIREASVDAVITSPPYLNAIDYMRGHRLSLVWMGYRLSTLSGMRSSLIGAEIALDVANETFDRLRSDLRLNSLGSRMKAILRRYFVDLSAQLVATAKVLRPKGIACYVIGNCNVRGVYIRNNVLLRAAAEAVGLRLTSESQRRIPERRRYLPLSGQASSSLGSRMRTEHILEFRKTA